VKVAFDHRTQTLGGAGQALTIADGSTPTVFGMKLVTMYLAEDVGADSNKRGARLARVWLNPACDPDSYHCSIAAAAGPYQIKDYFDLALPSAGSERPAQFPGQSPRRGKPTAIFAWTWPGRSRPTSTPRPTCGSAPAASAHEVRLETNGYLIPARSADGHLGRRRRHRDPGLRPARQLLRGDRARRFSIRPRALRSANGTVGTAATPPRAGPVLALLGFRSRGLAHGPIDFAGLGPTHTGYLTALTLP